MGISKLSRLKMKGFVFEWGLFAYTGFLAYSAYAFMRSLRPYGWWEGLAGLVGLVSFLVLHAMFQTHDYTKAIREVWGRDIPGSAFYRR